LSATYFALDMVLALACGTAVGLLAARLGKGIAGQVRKGEAYATDIVGQPEIRPPPPPSRRWCATISRAAARIEAVRFSQARTLPHMDARFAVGSVRPLDAKGPA
jgi:hypothetical protein